MNALAIIVAATSGFCIGLLIGYACGFHGAIARWGK